MRALILFLSLLISSAGWAMKASEYLPADANLDPAIPTPESVLGWDVGEWRVSHDLLVKYMETLAASSDRISLKVIGHTWEQRPLLQLLFTSPANHGRVEEMRQQHLRSATGTLDADAPLVLWLGHSVHGNEASGSNAVMLVAYYLAASRSDFVVSLLKDSIILVDPSFNPDGLNRFATWANTNRSMNPVADRNHRVHNEAWPSARTNHYLFDLNRDWLPLVHPESSARIAEFQDWLPHVLTDQHERSRDGYFFQPGVPSRQHPLTPQANFDLTRELAGFHAKAMDQVKEHYFTEDDYDDFYMGKGSTYPDMNGSIGILFEQPSIKGPVLDRNTGRDTFVEAIQNQLRTSLSTLQGSVALREKLNRYQHEFFRTMADRAARANYAAWVVGDDGDPARAAGFFKMLDQHRIEYQPLGERLEVGRQVFQPGHAWVIPAQQRQFGMLEVIMETRTEFADNVFYDVSAWTQPLAYNLPHARLSRLPQTGKPAATQANSTPDPEAIAWIVDWRQMQAPAVLQKLLDTGVRVRAAVRPFTAHSATGNRNFAAGTLVVHAGMQDNGNTGAAVEVLQQAALSGVSVFSSDSSLTPDGPDLGALHFGLIKPIKPLLLVGEGTTEYEVGHIWHHFDQRLGITPVMVEISRLGSLVLSDYTHLVLADGTYSRISSGIRQRIVQWINEGGTLITAGRASNWAESLCFAAAASDCKTQAAEHEQTTAESRAYAQFPNDQAQQEVDGAIVATTADLTHPMTFGLSRPDLPLFRRYTTILKGSKNPYSSPVRYTSDPLMAGFMGPEQQDKIRNQPAVIAERQGRGLVVRFANDPVFRGFWKGGETLLNNALYMGQVIENTQLPD